MLEDFITREHASRAHLLNPKYEVIVHEQIWDDYKTWYIIETYGDGGIRVTIDNDNPSEAIISDLFVSEYMRQQKLGTYLLNFVKFCICEYNEKHGTYIKGVGVAANDISAHMFEKFGFVKEKDGRYILY